MSASHLGDVLSSDMHYTQKPESIEAIELAGATAGKAVLFSGFTVIVALCGMLLMPFFFK